jgi:four helix bundle protein
MSATNQRVRPIADARPRTRHFRDLIAWQKSMLLVREVYKATADFPHHEIYSLTSQIRRCAVSIPSNIAEGHGRLTDSGLRVFLAQARGSLFELETQLQLAADIGYLQAELASALVKQCNEVARILNGLLKAIGGDKAS